MTDERGSALVEFTYLGVLLMVPLVYVLLTVFAVQSAAFGVTEAARAAGRAVTSAQDLEQGRAAAVYAARLALQDQGIDADVTPDISCGDTSCRVSVRYAVPLPVVGGLFGAVPASIPVTGEHVAARDRYAAR